MEIYCYINYFVILTGWSWSMAWRYCNYRWQGL